MALSSTRKQKVYSGLSWTTIAFLIAVSITAVVLFSVDFRKHNGGDDDDGDDDDNTKKITKIKVVDFDCDVNQRDYTDVGNWENWGNGRKNDKSQDGTIIWTKSVKDLKLKRRIPLDGDITGITTLFKGYKYTCTISGSLYAADSQDNIIWQKSISDYTGVNTSWCRTAPAIENKVLVIGVQDSGTVIAIDRTNGDMLWKELVDNHTAAIITTSMTIVNGMILGGVSSREEELAAFNYTCCSFVGSAFALDITDGRKIWLFETIPRGLNYSGAAIWGSSPSYDLCLGLVYFATGNLYTVPSYVQTCVNQTLTDNGIIGHHCINDSNVWFETVFALNILTGDLVWARNVSGYDAWVAACIFGTNPSNCPSNPGPDYDFGQLPIIFDMKHKGKNRKAVGVGQKSGVFWTFDAETGQDLWNTAIGPGSTLGGLQWGTAASKGMIYFALANKDQLKYHIPVKDKHGKKSNKVHCSGAWGALDVNTGEILWMTPDPLGISGDDCDSPDPSSLAFELGPVTVTNDVMFAGSFSGHMYGFDIYNGDIVWSASMPNEASINTAPSMDKNCIYFGDGYSRFGLGNPGGLWHTYCIEYKQPKNTNKKHH